MKVCLFNTCSDNTAGYCKKHRCALTVKQIRCRECLNKQCWYFVKNEEHAWWKQREIMKQKRKSKKENQNKLYV